MEFHVLSFEGPDAYARAGGIATRIDGLTRALAAGGHDTHLWFVGDPALPGQETVDERLHLHRWCQWISGYHPGGVYDGEEGKERDFAASLPPHLLVEGLVPALQRQPRAIVLAEEWHTVHAVLHLDWLLRATGLRERVSILWNANNTFGFDAIDWPRLARAATITTVSRYMRQRMGALGVDSLVIPNGLGPESFEGTSSRRVRELEARVRGRPLLAKVARFDPDKRWLTAIEITAALRQHGAAPLLVARGGSEGHGADVLRRASSLGLRVGRRRVARAGERGLLEVLEDPEDLDVLVLDSHLDAGARRLLYRGAKAVLANSSHEPFGLVGLETMAAGGIACTGGTGEDYVDPGRNALVMRGEDPREFVALFDHLRREPGAEAEIRRSALRTSRDFAWSRIVPESLLPRVGGLAS